MASHESIIITIFSIIKKIIAFIITILTFYNLHHRHLHRLKLGSRKLLTHALYVNPSMQSFTSSLLFSFDSNRSFLDRTVGLHAHNVTVLTSFQVLPHRIPGHALRPMHDSVRCCLPDQRCPRPGV